MKIGIDARLMGPSSRGIGRYIERLLTNLAKLDNENEYTVFARAEAIALVPKKMKAIVTDIRWYTLAEQIKLGKIFDAARLDLVHVPHWNAPLRLKTPLAITIHDMILWEHPSLASTTLPAFVYWAKYFFYRFVVSQNIKRAKIVFTVSESAKNSILRNLKISPEKIIVTPNGIDPLPYSPPPSAGEGCQQNLEVEPLPAEVQPQYILSVGSGYPHKNMATFFKVAKELMTSDQELAAIVAGTDPAFMERLKKQAAEILGKDIDRVKFAGLVSDAELGILYKNANALVFTSQVEGFGLPPLEAALAGTLVVASSIDTSREMFGSIIPLIEPTDVAGFVAAYRKIMADSAYKTAILSAAKARAQTFLWQRTARLTQAGYKRCFSTR
jgi:glycosyltransferase involved in cell wall biosynthesis